MAKKTNLRLIAVAVMVVLIGTGSAWADLTDGLVAHWKLDETDGTTAYDSAGSNDGTIYGATPTTGQVDGALELDGIDDYVNLDTHIGDFSGMSAGSMGIWIKNEGVDRHTAFFSAGDAGDHKSHVNFELLPWEVIKVRVCQNDSSKLYWMSDEGLPSGWHHFVYATNSSGNWVYLDGSPWAGSYTVGSSSTRAFFSDVTNQDYMRIGCSMFDDTDYWHWEGGIDDVRIYDRALSDEEVEELYRGELLSLEITGPDTVAEDSQAQYKAIAYFDNNSTADVTDLAVWSVDPNDIASITAGLLTTEAIDLPEDITITAEYGTEIAQKDVSILAICPSGYALEFDGRNDYVDCGNGESLDNMSEITLSAWVYIKNWNTGKYSARIISKCHYPFSAYELTVDGIDGKPNVNVGFYGKNNIVALHSPDGSIGLNNWYHITATNTGNEQKIYLDGIEVASDNVDTGAIRNIEPNLWIGQITNAYVDSAFEGLIDEVAIYSRALSAEEIWAGMHKRPDTGEPNLVAYYDFDEGSGQVANDSAGGNHGVLGSTGGVDSSDPNWVDSIAPVGICSVEGIVERNLLNVLGMKNDVLDILDEAIGKEEALWEYMDTVFKNRDFGNTSKSDVVKAKQKIMGAIQHEEQAETAVDQSIDKLDDAMNTLGLE